MSQTFNTNPRPPATITGVLPEKFVTASTASTAASTGILRWTFPTRAGDPTVEFLHRMPQPTNTEAPPIMRTLYLVYIVDPASDTVTEIPPFVAKDESTARLKALQRAGNKVEKDVDKLDFVVIALGPVRPKKEVQEVKIAKE